jgi:hypothetical protein
MIDRTLLGRTARRAGQDAGAAQVAADLAREMHVYGAVPTGAVDGVNRRYDFSGSVPENCSIRAGSMRWLRDGIERLGEIRQDGSLAWVVAADPVQPGASVWAHFDLDYTRAAVVMGPEYSLGDEERPREDYEDMDDDWRPAVISAGLVG